MKRSKVLAFVGPTHNGAGQESVNAYHHRKVLEGDTNKVSAALVAMLKGWEGYADAHRTRYETGIGTDYVLGDYWAEMGLCIKRLLDGETGGLDCGSIAHNIIEAIRAEGFETDGYVLESKDE